ncbi:MAG: hypothetical protein ABJ308_04220 [Halieaceae bacterium]
MIRVFCIAAGVALTLMLSPLASAETSVEEAQRLYREHCRHCHTDGSEAGKYNPTTLIQAQWIRFFDRKYEREHRKVIDTRFGDRPVTEVISPEELEKIRRFAVDHAADTEQPMTCDD